MEKISKKEAALYLLNKYKKVSGMTKKQIQNTIKKELNISDNYWKTITR